MAGRMHAGSARRSSPRRGRRRLCPGLDGDSPHILEADDGLRGRVHRAFDHRLLRGAPPPMLATARYPTRSSQTLIASGSSARRESAAASSLSAITQRPLSTSMATNAPSWASSTRGLDVALVDLIAKACRLFGRAAGSHHASSGSGSQNEGPMGPTRPARPAPGTRRTAPAPRRGRPRRHRRPRARRGRVRSARRRGAARPTPVRAM